jgi:hypothetical protein
MTTHTRRVPAAAMMPTTNTTTFDNYGQIDRWALRSTDANARFLFPISDVQTNDTFTKLSLSAALSDNLGTFQVWASLMRSDATGMLAAIAHVQSTATGGIAKVDSVTITSGWDASPKVDLTKFTYAIRVIVSNSSPTPHIWQIVVPWVEYTYER